MPALNQVLRETRLGQAYLALVEAGSIERDRAQVGLVRKLDALATDLETRQLARKTRALGWLFARRQAAAPMPKGLYIWGAVGRGKTMLMDLFAARLSHLPVRRTHFNSFMADVHARIHAHREAGRSDARLAGDPIPAVAQALASEARVLCFDEFSVTDIADAMILGRLFDALFGLGVTLVATSNVEPSRLYEGGLNRALFVPFLQSLLERVEVVELEARADFRLEKLSGAVTWHVPANVTSEMALSATFRALSGVAVGAERQLAVLGHVLTIPQMANGVARARFADLCGKAYAAADYAMLAREVHTLVLDDVPILSESQRNEAKRFITLIDTLYEARVKLVASAGAEPDGLYPVSHGREAFEFARTVSRLVEMRSQDYLALAHGAADSAARGTSTGLVET